MIDVSTAKVTKNYNNLTLINGGKLRVVGGFPIGISVKSAFTVDNNSSYIRLTENDREEGDVFTYTAPDGALVTARIPQGQGGAGGGAGDSPGNGGQGVHGNGGGGGGFTYGNDGNVDSGGDGSPGLGDLGDNEDGVNGGMGGSVPSGDGGAGDFATGSGGVANGAGAGGAGRGPHGGRGYFAFGGTISVPAGVAVIIADGGNGGNGGAGGGAQENSGGNSYGGGGGGPGAGGSGGDVQVLKRAGQTLDASNVSVNSGVAGTPGTGGAAVFGASGGLTTNGEDGYPADDGRAGTVNISNF